MFVLTRPSQLPLKQIYPDVIVFHAGTKKAGDETVTAGGRVLAVTSRAPTLQAALDAVYTGVKAVNFEGMTYRRDIAHRCSICSSSTLYIINTPSARALATTETGVSTGMTYAQAGVSVDTGNLLVETIKPYVRSTRRPGADGEIGGFGGAFDLKATGYKDPILVSGTDGVGTKLQIAVQTGIHDSVGKWRNDLLLTSNVPFVYFFWQASTLLQCR